MYIYHMLTDIFSCEGSTYSNVNALQINDRTIIVT